MMSKEGEGMFFDPGRDRKRILIAGGSGFIGQHLCKKFLQMGYIVISWDRNFTQECHCCEGLPNFGREKRDITKFSDAWVSTQLDYILHFASHVSPRDFLKYPEETLRANSEGTRNLLILAAHHSARFIFASSARVYRGEDPASARGVYEQAKRFSEAMISTWQRGGLIDSKIVRMYGCYGPGARVDDGHVIPMFITRALRNEPIEILGGGQWVHFTYIDDMIDGLLRVLFSDDPGPVELGTPEQIRIDSLAKTIIRLCGSTSEVKQEASFINDERPPILARATALGWKPKINIQEGLQRTIEDFRRRM